MVEGGEIKSLLQTKEFGNYKTRKNEETGKIEIYWDSSESQSSSDEGKVYKD